MEDGNFRLNTRFLDPHPATSPPTNQKKVTHPAAHTPHFAYKNSLKTFGGFGSFFEQEPRILLKTFSAPDARISICLASLCSAESLLRCFRREHPFQGSKVGSCLTLRSELSKETCVLTRQQTLSGRGARVGSRRVREPGRTALPCELAVLGFMVMGFIPSFSPVILIQGPSWWHIHGMRIAQPRWILERRTLGSW